VTPRPNSLLTFLSAAWERICFGHIAAFIMPIGLCIGLVASECPDWCIRGIIATETSSFYRDGRVVYVNKSRGKDGERGIGQALPSTLREHGYSPSLYEQDVGYALEATRAILVKYRKRTGSWIMAVAAWHKPYDYESNTAQSYARKVLEAAGGAQ